LYLSYDLKAGKNVEKKIFDFADDDDGKDDATSCREQLSSVIFDFECFFV